MSNTDTALAEIINAIAAQDKQIKRLQNTIKALSYPCAGDLMGLIEQGTLTAEDLKSNDDTHTHVETEAKAESHQLVTEQDYMDAPYGTICAEAGGTVAWIKLSRWHNNTGGKRPDVHMPLMEERGQDVLRWGLGEQA